MLGWYARPDRSIDTAAWCSFPSRWPAKPDDNHVCGVCVLAATTGRIKKVWQYLLSVRAVLHRPCLGLSPEDVTKVEVGAAHAYRISCMKAWREGRGYDDVNGLVFEG